MWSDGDEEGITEYWELLRIWLLAAQVGANGLEFQWKKNWHEYVEIYESMLTSWTLDKKSVRGFKQKQEQWCFLGR